MKYENKGAVDCLCENIKALESVAKSLDSAVKISIQDRGGVNLLGLYMDPEEGSDKLLFLKGEATHFQDVVKGAVIQEISRLKRELEKL